MNHPGFVPVNLATLFGQQQSNHNAAEPPMRVQVALEFLRYATQKSSVKIAVNDVGIEQVDGDELTIGERTVQASACDAIHDYLRGNLEPDQWEQPHARKGKPLPIDQAGMLLRCPACAFRSAVLEDCVFCRGLGQCLVFPTGGDGK